jgi:hypothetical protein
MLLVREVFHCKPGKVRPMVEMFLAMAKFPTSAGVGRMRVMTDFAGERYWTVVGEFEVESMQKFEEMMQGAGMSEEDTKEMGEDHEGLSRSRGSWPPGDLQDRG